MDPSNIYANAAAAAAAGQMFIDPSIMATMTANMEGLGGNLAGLAGLGGVGGVGVVPGLEPPRTSLRSADTFQCALRSCDQPPQRKHVINKDTKKYTSVVKRLADYGRDPPALSAAAAALYPAGALYVCHSCCKSLYAEFPSKRKRKGSRKRKHATVTPYGTVADFSKVDDRALKRYKQAYAVRTKYPATKEDVVASVSGHFRSAIAVSEFFTISEFIKALGREKEEAERNEAGAYRQHLFLAPEDDGRPVVPPTVAVAAVANTAENTADGAS